MLASDHVISKNDSVIYTYSLFNLPLSFGQLPGRLLTFPQKTLEKQFEY